MAGQSLAEMADATAVEWEQEQATEQAAFPSDWEEAWLRRAAGYRNRQRVVPPKLE